MLGPVEAKKIMYGSDHASRDIQKSVGIHVSNLDTQKFTDGTTEGDNEKHEIQSVMPKAKKSTKSKSTLRNKDDFGYSVQGTVVGGKKHQKNMKW